MTPSNPRNQIRCPYCSKFFPKSETDVDHVIASAWYPTNVPATFQRYTVRACCGCNGRLGKIEEDILHHLAGCLDPQNPAVRPIVDKLSRALDPSAAKSAADRQKREARRRHLQNDMVDASDVPRHKFAAWTLPNIKDGQPSRAIRVPTTLAQVAEKWVRGIYYKTTKSFLPDAYAVQSVPVTDESEVDILNLSNGTGRFLRKARALLLHSGSNIRTKCYTPYIPSRSGTCSACMPQPLQSISPSGRCKSRQ